MARQDPERVPDFDDVHPWGHHAPSERIALALALAHRLPRPLAGLARWLRRPVRDGMSTPLDIEIWGYRLRLLPRGNLSEQKLYTSPRHFDARERAVMAERLRPGAVFVDIGANAGLYSLWAHRCMQGRGRILAVEPDPEMRRRMAFNFRTNSLAGIELCPLALSDHEGQATLKVHSGQRGMNTIDDEEARRTGGSREALSVPVTTLTALLHDRQVERVDLLKIDIEGHEPPVLRHFLLHADSALWPRTVIAELKAQTAAEVLALFEQRGYRRQAALRRNVILERA